MDHQPFYEFRTVDSSKRVIDDLLNEKALIGFLSPLDYLQARQDGVPLAVLSSPFQFTPISFALKKNVFMRSYEDLKGKRVLYEPGTLGEILFRHFLRQVHLTYQDLIWVKHDPENHKSFDNADIVILDTIPEIVQFEKKKETDLFLYPYEYDIHFKGPLIVTSEKQLQSNPIQVKELANLAVNNFTENIFNRKNIYSVFLQKSIPYVFQQDRKVGEVTEKDWWRMERLLLEEAALENPVSIEEYMVDPSDFSFKPDNAVQLAMPGLPSADFSGFYVAEDKGHYERVDRPITLKHFPNEQSVINSVREGDSLLGVVSAFSLLEAQVKTPEFVLLAVIFQTDPTVFIALKDQNVKRETGLISKNLFLSKNALGVYLSFIRPTPIKHGDMEVEEMYPTPFALLDGRAKVISGRRSFNDRRLKPYQDLFEIIDHQDIEVVGYSIFTTFDKYEKNKELIKSILKSTFHGYENSIFQVRQAAMAVTERDPSLSYRQVQQTLNENKLYLRDESGIIGTIIPEKWYELAQAAREKEFIDTEVDFDYFFPQEVTKRYSDKGSE